MMRMQSRADRRPGFTLVELLVVIAVMAILFGLTAAFMPAVFQRNNATRGGQMVATMLAQARTKAKRDGGPVGIRFQVTPDPNITGRKAKTCVTKLTWVAQPDDIVGTTGITLQSPKANQAGFENLVTISGASSVEWDKIKAGDYLEVFGNGLPHRITHAMNGGIRVASPFPYPIPATSDFRIRRQPVPLVSEPEVKLPYRIAVDLFFSGVVANGDEPPYKPTQELFANGETGIDIIFTPTGNVIGGPVAVPEYQLRDKMHIVLVILDTGVPEGNVKKGEGNSTVVGVNIQTGLIGSGAISAGDLYGNVLRPGPSGL